MFHPLSLRRGAIAIILFSTLALTPAVPAAAEPSGPYRQEIAFARHAGSFGRLSHLWHMLLSLWEGEGATSDPNGVRP